VVQCAPLCVLYGYSGDIQAFSDTDLRQGVAEKEREITGIEGFVVNPDYLEQIRGEHGALLRELLRRADPKLSETETQFLEKVQKFFGGDS
jgi:hypothetical protein